MKTNKILMSICPLCDAHYDDSDIEEAKIHDHPEPQSGPPRDSWIRSGLEYFLWTRKTPEGREWAEKRRRAQNKESFMSWGIQLIGWPDKINKRLQKYSDSLRDQSKAEFDEALPHLEGLISQVCGPQVMVKLNASGHATYSDGKKLQGHLSVTIEVLYAEVAV